MRKGDYWAGRQALLRLFLSFLSPARLLFQSVHRLLAASRAGWPASVTLPAPEVTLKVTYSLGCPTGHAGCSSLHFLATSDAGPFLGARVLCIFPLCGELQGLAPPHLCLCAGEEGTFVCAGEEATCTRQKDAEVAAIRTIPRNRNDRTRALPASAPGEALRAFTSLRARSHLWGQHLLLGWGSHPADMGRVAFDGPEDFQKLLLLPEMGLVLASR